MTIRVVCQKCGSKLDIKEELAGTTRRCPKCKTDFAVPSTADELEDGVSIGAEEDEEAVVAQAGDTELHSGEPSSDESPVESLSTPVRSDDDDTEDDDDEDYMPSFVTASSPGKAETKTPAPGEKTDDDDDDSEVFSIPKTPLAPKPKFKPFDPEEFSQPEPPSRSKKREVPASLEERPKRTRPNDDEDDVATVPRGKSRGGSDFNLPSPEKTGPSDSGGSTTGTKDRAQAARELRQALKESTLKAPPEAERERGIGFDFMAFMSEIGLKGLAIIVGVVVIFPAIYLMSDRMMGGGLKLPKLAHVSGTVTYNGQPAAGAMVFFQPAVDQSDPNTKKKKKIRTSFGQTDDKGHFKLMYMEGIQGVAVGKCRVWLTLPPPMIVPGEYSQASITFKDVAAGSQTIDFPLTVDVKRK